MFNVIGKITKRILSGDIPADTVNPPRSMNPKPSKKAAKDHTGQKFKANRKKK